MTQDKFAPKLGRIRDTRQTRAERHAALVLRHARRQGARALRQKGHVAPGGLMRGIKLQELSPVDVSGQTTYDGPTWLDQAILSKWQPERGMGGFAHEVREALSARGRWLASRNLATVSPTGGSVDPAPDMMRVLRRSENDRLAQGLSHVLGASYVAAEAGTRVAGIYDRAITTPTGRIAVIRREDTFTLAPWRPALEPFRGRAVTGVIGPSRVTWTLDRGRTLPGRT